MIDFKWRQLADCSRPPSINATPPQFGCQLILFWNLDWGINGMDWQRIRQQTSSIGGERRTHMVQ
jgi:hypothetical protein